MRIVSEGLSFSYDFSKKRKIYAFRGLDLTIEEGEFFGIIGQTGSGKSTFIQHLNALIPVQEGKLRVGDFDLDPKIKGYKKSLKSLRSRVGLVFQYPEYQLFADSVFKDVAFGVRNFFPSLDESGVERRVREAIRAVGLDYESVKDKSPFDLSGGQKRRVAIAGVLATEPDVLVLDEPVAGLDPLGKKVLMELLHSIARPDRTIIIVSHDMDEVCENCSRIAVFENGRLKTSGTPEEVFGGVMDFKLERPLAARIKRSLAAVGCDLGCKLKMQDLIDEITVRFKEKK